MPRLNNIVKFLNNYLKIKEVKDFSRNGLQVKGRPKVAKIAFTENASLDTFQQALRSGADLVVVHHGILWKSKYKQNAFLRITKERISFLKRNGLSLYAAHLPLDRHKIVGNNAQLLALLGAEIKSGFSGKKYGKTIGWTGRFRSPVSVLKLAKILNKKLRTRCKVLSFGPAKVRTIAVCSGGGGSSPFYEALDEKVDLYLSGEPAEVYTSAKEAKMNVIFAGHYATETVGVKALMEVVKNKFKVKTVFIDDPTGL
jgi:dinuclear metal center YbgI/SA1388 family protein